MLTNLDSPKEPAPSAPQIRVLVVSISCAEDLAGWGLAPAADSTAPVDLMDCGRLPRPRAA